MSYGAARMSRFRVSVATPASPSPKIRHALESESNKVRNDLYNVSRRVN